MAVTRCSNNHFYDSDKYSSCPHCGGSSHADTSATVALTTPYQDNVETNPTVALTQPVYNYEETNVTVPLTQPLNQPKEIPTPPPAKPISDEVKTVALYSTKVPIEPVVGWLVSIEGSAYGNSFKLKSGRNFIGRSSSMDVCLSDDNTVSRERHATVVFEPKAMLYLVSAGESKELAYLNDEVILMPQKLKIHDIITVGGTKLMFFPCCSEKLNWAEIIQEN